MSEKELGRETKEREPTITIDFLFSTHTSAEDFAKLPQLLEQADIYMPELAGWSKEELEEYNKIARGELNPATAKLNPALEKRAFALYNSKKPVVFVDTPISHELSARSKKIFIKKAREPFGAFANGRFELALYTMKQQVKDIAEHSEEREEYIRRQIKKEIKGLTKNFPQLRDKKDIRVLVDLGMVHTGVANILGKEERGLAIKKHLARPIMIFGLRDEVIRSMLAGKDPTKYDDTHYARMLVEGKIKVALQVADIGGLTQVEVARKLARKLSFEQIRALSEQLANRGPTSNFNTFLRAKLRRMGVVVPKTVEEANQLLHKDDR